MMDSRTLKGIACKSVRLDKCLVAYHSNGEAKDIVMNKFTQVWGSSLANHFLSKYDDAESMIWALDSENLEKLIAYF